MSGKSRGLAPIIIVVIIAVLLGGGFLLVKSGKLPISAPGISQLTPRATEKDFEFISDVTLRKHFVAQANVNKFRTKSQSSGKGEIVDTNEYDLSGNFAYRMVQENGVTKEEVSHLITIADTTYVKDYSDNKWWKQTLKTEELTEEEKVQEPDVKEELIKEDPATYKSLGQEACGDLTCYKYEQTLKDTPGSTRTFWFDTKQYLLRKEVFAYGEFSNEVNYSYDGVSITAPSPTKDVPEDKNIYEYLNSSGMSPEEITMPPELTIPPDYGNDSGY